MKNKTNLLIRILFLCFILISCQKYKPKKAKNSKQNPTTAMNKQSSKFSGNFFGVNNEKEIYVTLNSSSSSNKITGILTMNGEEAVINATEKNGSCSGTIIENNSKKTYEIAIYFVVDQLSFAITFPEYDNQVLTLLLSKINTKSIVKNQSINKEKNSALIGTWRFTEVLNSGSGDFYTSIATDYFLQFKSNGECITWTGKSAGGSNDVSIEDNGKSNVDIAQWHTAGNNVFFVNPTTNKEMSIPFYAEENRMILKGNLNRVYIRIN